MWSRLVLLSLVASSSAFAWGFDGHRRLASLMQDAMPQGHCLRTWFSSRQTTALQDKACDPDRWRGTDAAEAPRHYLEIDWLLPVGSYPRDYDAAVARLGDRNAQNNGIVPWHIEAKYADLVSAFRSQNQAAILDTAFVMSHYVFDSFSILHNTRNFDPNMGLHARWESDMLNSSTNINGITTLAQSYYGTPGRADPRYNAFDIIVTGNGLVNQLIQADTAANGSISALYTSTRDLTARRWGDGITVMSSILWTAWAEAGSPNLTGFSTSCSRSVPVAEIVLRGYPTPGGFTHADGGVDAGVTDAGMSSDAGVSDGGVDGGNSGGGAGGGNGGFGGGFILGGGFGGGGGGSSEPGGCSCTSAPMDAVLVLGLLALARRRRR